MCNPKRGGGRDAMRHGPHWITLLMIKCQAPNVCVRLPVPIDINELVFSFWIFSSFISFGSFGRWRVCLCLSCRRHCAFMSYANFMLDVHQFSTIRSQLKTEAKRIRKTRKEKKRNWIFPLFVRIAFAPSPSTQGAGACHCRKSKEGDDGDGAHVYLLNLFFRLLFVVRSAPSICFHSIGSGHKSI